MQNRGFATTRWSLVLAAGREPTTGSRAAFSELCELYWPPVYAFARRQGYEVHEAEDLTQAFFTRLLEKHVVQAADPQRGRFRSFLLASFKNFVANERDREHAQKRGSGQVIVGLDFESAEARYSAEPVDTLTPDAVFERQWAVGVLNRVLATLRAECITAGKVELFDQVRDLLGGDRGPGGYAAIARSLGTTEGAVKVNVHRLRRRYGDLLRANIEATVSDASEVDDEMAYLMTVVSR